MSHAFGIRDSGFQINDDTPTTKRVAQRLVTRCGFFVAIFAAVFVFPFQFRGNGKSVLSLHLWPLQMTAVLSMRQSLRATVQEGSISCWIAASVRLWMKCTVVVCFFAILHLRRFLLFLPAKADEKG